MLACVRHTLGMYARGANLGDVLEVKRWGSRESRGRRHRPPHLVTPRALNGPCERARDDACHGLVARALPAVAGARGARGTTCHCRGGDGKDARFPRGAITHFVQLYACVLAARPAGARTGTGSIWRERSTGRRSAGAAHGRPKVCHRCGGFGTLPGVRIDATGCHISSTSGFSTSGATHDGRLVCAASLGTTVRVHVGCRSHARPNRSTSGTPLKMRCLAHVGQGP